MKLVLFGSAIALLAASLTKPATNRAEPVTLIIGGDVLGYLAPCGCTKPMVGGIQRWASAARTLGQQGKTVVVVNGGFAKGQGRQDELKLESLAESYRTLSVQAVNVTEHETAMGRGALSSLQHLTDNALTSLTFEPGAVPEIQPTILSGPFLIAGASQNVKALASGLGEIGREGEVAAKELVEEASGRGAAPVLLWAGDESSARSLAEKHPELVAIVFRSTSVLRSPIVVGKTWLISPGEKGRQLVSARWDGQSFTEYGNVTLGPEIGDDEDVTRAYSRYLERVGDENLLMDLPRPSDDEYIGTEACLSCHQSAAKVWKESKHARALATLEEVKHNRDPDCVGCHVVGLDSVKGFKSRTETPTKANVGCESCHGAGNRHAMEPAKVKTPRDAKAACLSCHVTDHSPNFDFSTYWEKIRH